jgi:hypothetical protein
MTEFELNITGFVPNMTGIALNRTWFI